MMAKKKKRSEAERAALRAEDERVLANAERLRSLAEKAQAELDAKNAAKRD
jgi:hypothetical protein